jgi:oligopeptide transport system ATP-binding protein
MLSPDNTELRSDLALSVESVRVVFGRRTSPADRFRGRKAGAVVALDGVSVNVDKGEAFGIVGESGSGKSTLARAVVRLVKPEAGRITVEGVDVLAARGQALRDLRRRVGLIYQDPYASLNPFLSVGSAIGEAARVHGLVSRSDERDRTFELMNLVGLPVGLATRRPRNLSGGQRQRVAIARALAAEPTLLIADEAVSALDVSVQAQVLNLLAELQRDLNLSMVVISHQLSVISFLCRRVAVLYLGRIVEEGPTEAVLRDPVHPYTKALRAAHPTLEAETHVGQPLRGEIPSPLDIPSGCRFRTRCPLAEDRCRTIDPSLVEVSAGHRVACTVLTG